MNIGIIMYFAWRLVVGIGRWLGTHERGTTATLARAGRITAAECRLLRGWGYE